MILQMLNIDPTAHDNPADRLRAVYGGLQQLVPAMAWNAARLVPGVGETLHGIDAWIERAKPEEASALLDALMAELQALRSGAEVQQP